MFEICYLSHLSEKEQNEFPFVEILLVETLGVKMSSFTNVALEEEIVSTACATQCFDSKRGVSHTVCV